MSESGAKQATTRGVGCFDASLTCNADDCSHSDVAREDDDFDADAEASETEKATLGLGPVAESVGESVAVKCPICLEDFQSDGGTSVSLECGHDFHAACIIPWFRRGQRSCPTCRDEPDETVNSDDDAEIRGPENVGELSRIVNSNGFTLAMSLTTPAVSLNLMLSWKPCLICVLGGLGLILTAGSFFVSQLKTS
jgi:hypothetical protein